MTFSRARPLGYQEGTPLTPIEINHIDVNQSRAVDGVGGGTYNTSAKLIFEGTAGMRANFSTVGLEIAGLGGAKVVSGSELAVQSGGAAAIESGGNLTVESGGTFTGSAGATVNVDTITVTNTANTVTLAARDVTRSECSMPAFDAGEWTIGGSGVPVTTAVGAGKALIQGITAPHGSTLKTFSVTIQPSGAHAGVPSQKPTLALEKRSLTTGATGSIGATVLDPSSTTGEYESVHTIEVAGLSEVIDRTLFRYYAVVTNESGANAAAGLVYFGSKRTVTSGRLDEAS